MKHTSYYFEPSRTLRDTAGDPHTEKCEAEDASFFSVYGKLPINDSGICPSEHLFDCVEEEDADQAMALLADYKEKDAEASQLRLGYIGSIVLLKRLLKHVPASNYGLSIL